MEATTDSRLSMASNAHLSKTSRPALPVAGLNLPPRKCVGWVLDLYQTPTGPTASMCYDKEVASTDNQK